MYHKRKMENRRDFQDWIEEFDFSKKGVIINGKRDKHFKVKKSHLK